MGFPLPPVSLNAILGPPMAHRFGVYFFAAGTVQNPLDIRFQEVSGLQAAITTRPDTSAASRLCRKLIPTGIDYSDLELRRGLVIGSPLAQQIQATFNDFKFIRSDVLLTIFSENALPTQAFLFAEAYPIAWEINSLSAKTEEILIESMKLTYTRVRTVSL
ncbi:MAG: phage tail protein [Cyanobacteriota bacterium]|nr:phage tail protein [Cyanobacteriota bacterium]